MEMEVVPLPESLFNQAVLLGVRKIHLKFFGGSDEVHLNVWCDVNLTADNKSLIYNLEQAVESWAWEVYEYSGAGDGHDYGDDITYSIEDRKVITSGWYTERKNTPEDVSELFFAFPQESEMVIFPLEGENV